MLLIDFFFVFSLTSLKLNLFKSLWIFSYCLKKFSLTSIKTDCHFLLDNSFSPPSIIKSSIPSTSIFTRVGIVIIFFEERIQSVSLC